MNVCASRVCVCVFILFGVCVVVDCNCDKNKIVMFLSNGRGVAWSRVG